MGTKQSEARFRAAKTLFAEKRYQEALEILHELDGMFPNTRNIQYPYALCLAKLKRYDEAAAICGQLVAVHEDARAQRLLARMADRVGDLPDGGDPVGLSDAFAPPSAGALHTRRKQPWGTAVAVTGGSLLLAFLALGAAYALLRDANESAQAHETGTGALLWYDEYDAAMRDARKYHAPAFLAFLSGDAEDADTLKVMLNDPDLEARLRNMVCVRLSAPEAPGAASAHSVKKTPTVIVLSAEGTEALRLEGSVTIDDVHRALRSMGLRTPGEPYLGAFAWIALPVVAALLAALALYITLAAAQKLPHEEWSKDIPQVGLMGIGVALLSLLVPGIGAIAAIIILRRVHGLSVLDFVMLAMTEVAGLAVLVLGTVLLLGPGVILHLALGGI